MLSWLVTSKAEPMKVGKKLLSMNYQWQLITVVCLLRISFWTAYQIAKEKSISWKTEKVISL